MVEVLRDSFFDALKLLPFLLLLYILIELLEHETSVGRPGRALSGKCAPLVGAAAGLIPMCGFSVMAAKLYEKKFLTLGALFAVFVSTNDEALLVLALSQLSAAEKAISISALLGIKLVLGVGVGYLVDLLFRNKTQPAPPPHMHATEHDEEEHGKEGHGEKEPAVCEHKHENKLTLYLLSPLWHAVKVAAVIFVFNLAFGALFWALGEENVIGFLQGAGRWYQPVFAALVGLVPNCASSVVIAETYAVGGIAFGSLVGGLVTNAGFGVFVLFRNARAWKRNLLILLTVFLLGVAAGYLVGGLEALIL